MPDISLCLTTYQKPWHLRRALASILAQQNVDGRFELVVADDGSTDETPEIVEQFRKQARFRVAFTTHPHGAYQVSRVRNAGALATTAPYILFLDGDCVLPPDNVAIHLEVRRPNQVALSDSYRVDDPTSKTLTEEGARDGAFLRWDLRSEARRLAGIHRRAGLYSLIRHPRKPKLVGNNFGIWRSDLDRVNGFDENFSGWGQEDDDLGMRLLRAGVRLKSILNRTRGYHLWHPRDASTTPVWRDGGNISYFLRPGGLIRCRNGLMKRPLAEVDLRMVGRPADAERVRKLWQGVAQPLPPQLEKPLNGTPPEAEILFLPGTGGFSGRAQHQTLVVLDDAAPEKRLVKSSHLIVADREIPAAPHTPRFALADFAKALDSIA